MKTSGIRNIIFDFGGVLINIDFLRTINAYKKLGAEDFDRYYTKAAQSGVFDELDKGHISAEAFATELSKFLPSGVSTEQIIAAWNEIIIDLPAYRIEMLRTIKPHYRTFLLSNTNDIHYEIYNAWLRDEYGSPDFTGLFDGVYLSFRLGMRKPEREIFDLVLHEQGLKKEETLFVDDSLHIIHATQAMGIPSCWLKDGQDVCDLFENGKLREEIDAG
jgi:glucose-1-phosphatase